MKKIYTILTILTITTGFSQALHTVDFEASGVGYDWTWTGAEGGVIEHADNPSKTGINTSDKVMKLTKGTGPNWALAYTASDGEFTVDANNAVMKIMVYKPVASNVCFKIEGDGTTYKELCVANTQVNTWEEITFDFTSEIGKSFYKLVVIPDNAASGAGVHYFDNMQVPDGVVDYGTVTNLTTDFSDSFFSTGDGAIYTEANNIGTIEKINNAHYTHIHHSPQGGFNFSAPRGLRLELKGPRAIPVQAKFEGSGSVVEVIGQYTTAGSWQTIDLDFSSASNEKRDKLVIFFDILAAASDPLTDDTFQIKTFEFNALASLSVKDIDQMIQDVRLYPNPASEIVNISSAETIDRVSVYDLTGRVIKQSNPNKSSFRLNISDLNKGVYLIKLNAGDKESTTKLIK
jgi:hypothetical protein